MSSNFIRFHKFVGLQLRNKLTIVFSEKAEDFMKTRCLFANNIEAFSVVAEHFNCNKHDRSFKNASNK